MNNTPQEQIILGIETSCDETAAAVVRRWAHHEGGAGRNLPPGEHVRRHAPAASFARAQCQGQKVRGEILSNITAAQIAEHAPYGGVVPEIAARAHVESVNAVVAEALRQARLDFADMDGFAATAGPGLIGGVLVGLATAKAFALACDKPLLAINHLEGHALTARLTHGVAFPYLALLVSGGHTQIVRVEALGCYRCLGTTLDDAAGEIFDKVAKFLHLEYPGGPALERLARGGDATRFPLPRPMLGREKADFSFSGLKTATIRLAQKHFGGRSHPDIPLSMAKDLAASFQQAVVDCLADRVASVMASGAAEGCSSLVLGGGVGANAAVRARLDEIARQWDCRLVAPPGHLCVDNGAMIAWAAAERLARGWHDPLDVPARARWPLDERTAV